MIDCNLYQITETPSSLLIPVHLNDLFEMKVKEHKGIRNYFKYLLDMYEQISKDVMPKCPSPKCEYQEKNQKLQKYSFRPVNQDWSRLGLLADYLGLSKANLFVFLMLLDVMKWWKVMGNIPKDAGVKFLIPRNSHVGIPSTYTKIKLYQTFQFDEKNKNYSRNYQYF